MIVAKSGVRKVEITIRVADIFFICETSSICLKKSSSRVNEISGESFIGRDVVGEIGSIVQLVNRSVKILIFREGSNKRGVSYSATREYLSICSRRGIS